MAYIVDITCSDALLAGRNSFPRRNLGACKVRLERCHTGVDQQYRIIIVGYQRE